MVLPAISKFEKSSIYIFKYGEHENQEKYKEILEKSLGQIPFMVISITMITLLSTEEKVYMNG